MKKVIALLVVFAMVISLCGCNGTTVTTETESWVEGGSTSTDGGGKTTTTTSNGGSNNSAEKGNTSTSTGNKVENGGNSVINDPLNVDLKGATITVYQGDTHYSCFEAPDTNSKARRNQKKIIDTVQKELNCKLKVTNVEGGKLKTLVTASAAAGKPISNIITSMMRDAGYYIASGILADMTRVSSMDLSKDYMNNLNMLNASTLGGAKYAVTSEDGRRAWVTLYNKRILKELGYADNYLYDLVNSKKWNYSICRKIGKAAMKELDGKSGHSADDQWGFLFTDSSIMTSNAILNSGGALIKHDNNGYLKYNMTDKRVITSINLINDFYNKDGTTCKSITNWRDRLDAFAGGTALFSFQTLEHVATVASRMSDEFGLLPIPMVDGSTNYNTVLDWNADAIMIPAGQTAKDQYNAGAVIQALLSFNDNSQKTYTSEMKTRYLYDDASEKNMILAINSCKGNVEAIYSNTNETILTGTYRPFWELIDGKHSSIVTRIDETKSSTVKAINELNATAKKNKS